MIGFTVVRGDPSEEELAALAVALLALAPVRPPSDPGRAVASWRRPDRAPGFPGARSWRR